MWLNLHFIRYPVSVGGYELLGLTYSILPYNKHIKATQPELAFEYRSLRKPVLVIILHLVNVLVEPPYVWRYSHLTEGQHDEMRGYECMQKNWSFPNFR